MAQDKHYDVIIIGTGAGGGTLVHTLASTGKSILILERGDYVPREKANWDSSAVNVEAKYNTKEVWRDKDGKPLHPHTNYYVGGNTKFFGAALFRLRKEDFGALAHAGGVSPAWPISYDELEPYYTRAEHLYQVNGAREVFTGDVIVSSCGAINSAALLLRSQNDRHPHGLANSSGVVGRHYMGHINSVLLAISKTPNPTVFQKTLALNDFYLGDHE